jgi:hypothetical protein
VVRFQQNRYESINDLSVMLADAPSCFYHNSGHKPVRILFYRDGVSEGKFERVSTTEVKSVKLESNYKPTLTYIAMQKHRHTCLFPINRDQLDRSGNCLPSTVVDTHITSPYEFDFFLQSHADIQGTSYPTHYQVLYDEMISLLIHSKSSPIIYATCMLDVHALYVLCHQFTMLIC